jgi:hypothetical protein
MKLGIIVNEKFKNTVAKLLAQDTPIKTTLVLKGVVDLLNKELAQYEIERQALLKEHGSKNEKGELLVNEDRTVKFEKDKLAEYARAYNNLIDKDVPVPSLTVEELGEKVSLSYDDLQTLNGLVVHQ